MREQKMAKRSIGSLMRMKLSDITNSQPQSKLPTVEEISLQNLPTNNDCVEQLLKERVTLLQLLAERNKIIELSGAELQRLRSDIQKLQLQNWNLAQSNSHMLAELNLGRDRIKALQHEIGCKAALLKAKGMNMEVEGKEKMKCENNIPTLPQEVEERTSEPSPTASNEGKNRNRNTGRDRRRSTGSSATCTKGTSKKKSEEKRPRLRRRHSSARVITHEHEALEDLFEIEDAINPMNGEDSGLRNEGPRNSLGRPTRKAAEKVQSYKEIPLNVKMRRLQ